MIDLCPPLVGRHSRKSHWNSLLIAIRNIYILAKDQGECSRHGSSQCMLHELHLDVGRIALVSHQQVISQMPKHQALASLLIYCQAGQITLGSPLRTWASAVGGEHSRKEPFEQLVNSNSELLHLSLRPRRMLATDIHNLY